MARSRLLQLQESPVEKRHWRYEARKSVGKCARCSAPMEATTTATCPPCMTDMASGKQRAKAAGMCEDCWTAPAVPGRRFCAVHAQQRNARRQQRYWLRRMRHLCVRCGKKRGYKGLTLCKEHLGKERNRDHVRRQSDQSNEGSAATGLHKESDQSNEGSEACHAT